MNIKLELTREQAILLIAFFDVGYYGAHSMFDDLSDRVVASELLHDYFRIENDDVCSSLGNKINELKMEVKDEANLILHKMQGEINGELKS